MNTETQILADLTTTAAGGVSVVSFLDKARPSKNLAKGEQRLQTAIFVLDKKKDVMPRKEVRNLNQRYKQVQARGECLREIIDAPWTWKDIPAKSAAIPRSFEFARDAKKLHASVLRSSAKATSRKIDDDFGLVDTTAEPEQPEIEAPISDSGDAPHTEDSSDDVDNCRSSTPPLHNAEARSSLTSISERPEDDIALVPLSSPLPLSTIDPELNRPVQPEVPYEDPFVDGSSP